MKILIIPITPNSCGVSIRARIRVTIKVIPDPAIFSIKLHHIPTNVVDLIEFVIRNNKYNYLILHVEKNIITVKFNFLGCQKFPTNIILNKSCQDVV